MTKSRLDLSYSPDKICFTIDNVFSSKECSNIIARTEEQDEEAGYHEGTIRNVDERASHRCILHDYNFVHLLFKRMENYLPKFYTDSDGLKWELAGFNERVRILRYTKGHFFAPHRDWHYATSHTHWSWLTTLINLNSGNEVDFEGGETAFPSRAIYVPRQGEALIFDHKLFTKVKFYKMEPSIVSEWVLCTISWLTTYTN